MDRLESIVVGVDFSESSVRALEQALRIAVWNDARVRVFHVVPEYLQSYLPSDAGSRLEDLLSSANAGQDVPSEVIIGSPLAETLRLVDESAADLLVIGAFGALGEFTGSGVGVFAAQCMRHVPCKVLAVHHTLGERFRSIVACVDFSATAERSLRAAMRFARREEAELHVLHVPIEGDSTEDLTDRLRDLAVGLGEGESELRTHYVVTRPGDPGEAIIAYARKIETDLIALGTRGSGDLTYLLMGSTGERVLRLVRRSVLVTKPEGFIPPAARG